MSELSRSFDQPGISRRMRKIENGPLMKQKPDASDFLAWCKPPAQLMAMSHLSLDNRAAPSASPRHVERQASAADPRPSTSQSDELRLTHASSCRDRTVLKQTVKDGAVVADVVWSGKVQSKSPPSIPGPSLVKPAGGWKHNPHFICSFVN